MNPRPGVTLALESQQQAYVDFPRIARILLALTMQERRQNVRVRPTPEYEIRVEYEEGLVKVRLAVIDLAIGGIGVLVDELFSGLAPGTPLRLAISLPDFETFETEATLRHSTGRAGGRSGFHFATLTSAQQRAWSRAVSELLERGFSA